MLFDTKLHTMFNEVMLLDIKLEKNWDFNYLYIELLFFFFVRALNMKEEIMILIYCLLPNSSRIVENRVH